MTETLPSRADYPFFNPLRVRWAEVDLQKIVFNAHYLAYADCSFTEYWRMTGLTPPLEQNLSGGELFVRRVTIDYYASAVFDDELEIGVRCTRMGRSSLAFQAGMFRKGTDELLVVVDLSYVYAAPATATSPAKSKPIPDDWRGVLAQINGIAAQSV
jgi:acyl-CoA thioester hydrolase